MLRLTFLFLGFLVPAFASEPPQVAAARAYLEEALATSHYPGISYVVVNREGVLFRGASGREAVGGDRPMTVDSSTAIGSVTKSFTAMAVMRLVEEGILDLDTPVVHYLPWFQTANKEESDRITLRHLLSNSSGLPSLDIDILGSDAGPGAAARLVRRLSGYVMTRPAGASFEYSNEGFALAGLVASTVAKREYPALLADYVLRPLGMNRATTDPADFEKMGVTHGHYCGRDVGIAVTRPLLSMNYAAAGSLLRCSANDMGRYLRALLRGGELDGRRILTEESIDTLWQPQIQTPDRLREDPGSYGFGWMITQREGRRVIAHGGNALTMTSMVMLEPGRGRAIALLANSSSLDRHNNTSLATMANNVLHLLAGEPLSTYGEPKEADLTRNNFELDSAQQASFVGRFKAGGLSNMSLTIRLADGQLLMDVYEGSILIESGELDFLNDRRAVLRNIGRPDRVVFKGLHQDKVGGASFMGDVYSRQDDGAVVHNYDHRLYRFSLSQQWPVQWRGNEFHLHRDGMKIHGGLLEQAKAEEMTVRAQEEPGVVNLDESIVGRYWQGHAWRAGDVQKRLFVTNVGGKSFYLLLEAPRGKLSRALQEGGLDLLTTLSLL